MISAASRTALWLIRIGTAFGLFAWLTRLIFGQRITAVIGVTWKAAFRFRLFLAISGLLVIAVVGLPILIKDDGTARGFSQILLTYTLSVITALLGFSTLWLSCGTLARDIEECQMQMVAVKPIARWQIWIGKWLGIVSLNAVLLLLSGGCVYGLLQWRATKLTPDQQFVLRNEVLVARGSAHEENFDNLILKETERRFQERLKVTAISPSDRPEVVRVLHEQVKADLQIVPPGRTRPWAVDLGLAKNHLKGQPIYLRIKFNSANVNAAGTFVGLWQVGTPQKTRVWQSEPMSLAPDTFHEFEIPPDLFDEKGILRILFANSNNTAILFPLEDGLEVLFREGSFELNFFRGLGIILCWMALLAALGLASASLLSFPVAAFFSLAMLVLVLASGTMAGAVSDGTIMGFDQEKSKAGHSPADVVVIPMFRAILNVINLAKDFSPIDALSTGRSIPWSQLALAVGRIVIGLSGVLALIGIAIFSRRELATAQGTQ